MRICTTSRCGFLKQFPAVDPYRNPVRLLSPREQRVMAGGAATARLAAAVDDKFVPGAAGEEAEAGLAPKVLNPLSSPSI